MEFVRLCLLAQLFLLMLVAMIGIGLINIVMLALTTGSLMKMASVLQLTHSARPITQPMDTAKLVGKVTFLTLKLVLVILLLTKKLAMLVVMIGTGMKIFACNAQPIGI